MPVFELFSKRKKQQERAGIPDIYHYDKIPPTLRVQIVHIWRDAIGLPVPPSMYSDDSTISNTTWQLIHDGICREKGVFSLGNPHENHFEKCCNYLLKTSATDDVLDIVEFSFRAITRIIEGYQQYQKQEAGIKMSAAQAVAELNQRFVENLVGYQYESDHIVRIDSQFIHSEVVKPALAFLHEREFQAANADFLKAHEHYRAKDYKDAVVAAQRAFESALKCICKGLGLTIKPGDRASELIKAVRAAGIFPEYLDPTFDSYVAAIKSGLPEVRNNAGGHGSAPGAPPVPGHIAAYAIHLTAANIVLCVGAYQAKRGK